MSQDRFLILHGWGGNKPTHWQEILNQKLVDAGATVVYPKMPDPTAPNLHAWIDRADGALKEIVAEPGGPITVLTHSLGSITWMHLAARHGTSPHHLVDRVLLVAPPYVLPAAPPPDAPPSVTEFFPPALVPDAIRGIARETVIVASNNDDYATFDQTNGYAAKLEVPLLMLEGAGHISPYYGYGEWPWVFDWCLRKAEFPPVPKG
jgi:predicted alpha/beta hydrolase family esterase